MQIEAFSCPLGTPSRAPLTHMLLQALFGQIAKRLAATFDRHGYISQLPLSPFPASEIDWPSSWYPEFSTLAHTLLREQASADCCSWLEAQFALALARAGLVETVTFNGPFKHPLTFAGVTTAAAPTACEMTRDRVGILMSDGGRHDFERNAVGSEDTSWRPTAGSDLDSTALGPYNIEWLSYWPADPYTPIDDSLRPAFAAQIAEALGQLDRLSPAYSTWVREGLVQVAPSPRPDAATMSSCSWLIGMRQAVVAMPASVHETIDMLVHEASHQYYNLAGWCVPLVKRDAPAVYSILKGVERPLDKVLTGYHAFANIFLCFDEMARQATDQSESAQIQDRKSHTWTMVTSLDRSLNEVGLEHLTDWGREIYWGLANRITATAS